MFLTVYYKEGNEYNCQIIESKQGEEELLVELYSENLDDVFYEAIKMEEEYYEHKFSDKELELIRKSVDMELLLKNDPNNQELFNKYVELQGELHIEFINSGYVELRIFKDIVLAS